jgi:hypothetical protein
MCPNFRLLDLFCYFWHRLLEGKLNSRLLRITDEGIRSRTPSIRVLRRHDLERMLEAHKKALEKGQETFRQARGLDPDTT